MVLMVVSGSTKVMYTLMVSSFLAPPNVAEASDAPNSCNLFSLISWLTLFRTSTPSCRVTDVVVLIVLPSGSVDEMCLTDSDTCFTGSVALLGFVRQESLTGLLLLCGLD